MTRDDAEKLLENIVSAVSESVNNELVSEEFADSLLKKCLHIKVDDFGMMEFMVINENKNAFSIKPANITIDLKRAIEISFELLLTSGIPDSTIKSIQLVLLIAYKVVNLMKMEVPSDMAEIVYILHKLNAYTISVPISSLHKEIEKSNYCNEVKHIAELNSILDKLKSNKIIDIIDDSVILKEKLLYIK